MASNTFDINLVVFKNYFRNKQRVQSKIANLSHRRFIFNALAERFPCELDTGAWRHKLE